MTSTKESHELDLLSPDELDSARNFITEEQNKQSTELVNRILTNTIDYTRFKLDETQHILVLPLIFKSEFKNEENQELSLDNFLFFLNNIRNKLLFLNYKDECGRTALHYTGKYGYYKYFFKLLDMGAYLGIKDKKNKSPMSLVEREKLEKYFDSCIKPIIEQNSCYKKSLDYRNLVVVDYQKSFVPKETQESDFVISILNDDKLDYLLNHPIVDCYLHLKWGQMYWYFYFYFLLNFVVYILIIVYVFQFQNHHTGSLTLLLFAFCLYFIDIVIYFCAVNEKFLCYIQEYRYEKIITSTLMLLLTSIIFSVLYKDEMNYFVRVVSSTVALLSTYKLFCVLQLHYRTHLFVKILNQITKMFIKLMVLYIVPVIVAFACCFHLLADSELNGNFFSITFNTTLGFTGDIDNNFVEIFKTNQIVGHLYYLLFIFVLAIILHNLLIGFVSDEITKMREMEAIFKQKALAVYVTTVENMARTDDSTTGFLKFLGKVFGVEKLFNAGSSLEIWVCPKDKSKAKIVEIDKKYVKLPTKHVEKTMKKHKNNRRNPEEVLLEKLNTVQSELQKIQDELEVLKVGLGGRE